MPNPTQGDFWTTPGLIWKSGRYRNPAGPKPVHAGAGWSTPNWGGDLAASGLSAEGFYGLVQGYPEPLRTGFVESVRSKGASNLATSAGWEEGKGTLVDFTTGLTDRMDAYRQDPDRLYALSELRRRGGADYSAVSPQQKASMDLSIAQNFARASRQAATSAGARGVASSGAEIANQAQLGQQANVSGLQLDASVAMENERARAAATSELGRMTGLFGDQDLTYMNILGGAERELARMQGDMDYQASDWFAQGAAGFGYNEAKDALAELDAANQRAEDAVDDFLVRDERQRLAVTGEWGDLSGAEQLKWNQLVLLEQKGYTEEDFNAGRVPWQVIQELWEMDPRNRN